MDGGRTGMAASGGDDCPALGSNVSPPMPRLQGAGQRVVRLRGGGPGLAHVQPPLPENARGSGREIERRSASIKQETASSLLRAKPKRIRNPVSLQDARRRVPVRLPCPNDYPLERI